MVIPISPPILEADNYEYWSKEMKAWLMSLKLWDTVENGYDHDENNREKKEKNAAALIEIRENVSPSILPKISDTTIAKEAWDILKKEYHKPTRPGKTTPLIRLNARQTKETHLLVATLVATVTFTAGFTIPGGYNGNEGPNQGMAILTREAAFKAFMVTDTIALSLSISAVLLHFISAVTDNQHLIDRLIVTAANFTIYAVAAMVLAFVTGTYAVLPRSPGLAISVCVIGCFPLLIFLIFAITSIIEIIKGCSKTSLRDCCRYFAG